MRCAAAWRRCACVCRLCGRSVALSRSADRCAAAAGSVSRTLDYSEVPDQTGGRAKCSCHFESAGHIAANTY